MRGWIRFKAVKLKSIQNISVANKNANTNEYIYLDLDGEIKTYCLTEGDENPKWDTFYASNQGLFSEGNKLNITCIRKEIKAEILTHSTNIDESSTTQQSTQLSIKQFEATIVAELRYEYALNYLHKFGVNQTRVGLGFVNNNNIW
jgi:hypothetical protein